MNPSIPPGSFKPRRRVADELTSMSRRRSPRSFVACVAVLIGIATVVVPNPRPAQAVGADDTIMGPSRVTATQMAAWFQAKTTSPYRAGVPLEQLVSLYLSEGNLAGVRGDIAFAQSILETRWFSFPAGGLLTPAQNNFAGIGACDSCVTGITFATVQLGVRAQMQQLRRYADPNSRSWNIGAPPVQPLWASNAAYDAMNRTHGWAPYWQNLSGTWATAPSYAAIINQLYNSLWDSSGRPGAGRWGGWELPGGLAANSTSSAAGAVASGPAVASWQPNRLDVFAASSGGFLLHKWWDGQVWSVGWENLSNPPTGPIVGNPATVSWGPGRIDVFVRGTDNQLWRQAFDGQRWTGWSPLGGTLTASPTVASQGPNRLDVFVTGTDLQVWSMSWSETAWTRPEGRGGRHAPAWSSGARRQSHRRPGVSPSSCAGTTAPFGTRRGTAARGRTGPGSAARSLRVRPPPPGRRTGSMSSCGAPTAGCGARPGTERFGASTTQSAVKRRRILLPSRGHRGGSTSSYAAPTHGSGTNTGTDGEACHRRRFRAGLRG